MLEGFFVPSSFHPSFPISRSLYSREKPELPFIVNAPTNEMVVLSLSIVSRKFPLANFSPCVLIRFSRAMQLDRRRVAPSQHLLLTHKSPAREHLVGGSRLHDNEGISVHRHSSLFKKTSHKDRRYLYNANECFLNISRTKYIFYSKYVYTYIYTYIYIICMCICKYI